MVALSGELADGKEDTPNQPEASQEITAFLAEVKNSADPVALAMEVLKGQKFQGAEPYALNVLLEHWKDPRSEDALADVAKGEPKEMRDGFRTLAGEAEQRLFVLRAKKNYETIMKDRVSAEDRLKAVRDTFEKHPDWLDPDKRPKNKVPLVSLLVQAATEAGGKGVDVVVQSRALSQKELGDYIKAYPESAVEYGRQIGMERALSLDGFVRGLAVSENDAAAALLSEWLKAAKKKEDLDALVAALSGGKGGKQRLFRMLTDARPVVVQKAANILAGFYPSNESLSRLQDALEYHKQAEAPKEEIAFLEAVIKRMKAEIAEGGDK
jgi:hypothetical protein